MTCLRKIIPVFFMLLLWLGGAAALHAQEYRIGYFEANRFNSFIKTFKAAKNRFKELGWEGKIEFPVADACYTTDGSVEAKGKLPKIAKKLLARKDLDLLFVSGTPASKIILTAANCLPPGNPECNLPYPVLSSSVSDAVGAGLVSGAEDSGSDNFSVRIIPERYLRMFRIFHDEVRFKKLGLVYMDDPVARTYANVDDAEKVARERGFKVVSALLTEPIDQKKCEAALTGLVEQGIDALFTSVQTCFDWGKPNHDAGKNFEYLISKNIRVFARQGSQDVKAGALMGFSTIDFSSRGRFLVDMMIKILQGEKPRNLGMIDNAPPTIALNLDTAQKIGFDPSFDILGASDEIYQKITLPGEEGSVVKSPCDLLEK